MATLTCKLKPTYLDLNKESLLLVKRTVSLKPMKQRVSREEICLYQPVANNYKGLHIYPFSCFATEIVTVAGYGKSFKHHEYCSNEFSFH